LGRGLGGSEEPSSSAPQLLGQTPFDQALARLQALVQDGLTQFGDDFAVERRVRFAKTVHRNSRRPP
jgi:hypothetical protein